MLLPHWSINLLPIRELQLQEFVAFVHLLIILQTLAQHCHNRLLLLLLLHKWIPLRPMQLIFSTTIGPNINNRTMIFQQTDIIQDGGITLIWDGGNQGNQQPQQFQNVQPPPQQRVAPAPQAALVPPVPTPAPTVAPAPSSSTSLEELVRMMTLQNMQF